MTHDSVHEADTGQKSVVVDQELAGGAEHDAVVRDTLVRLGVAVPDAQKLEDHPLIRTLQDVLGDMTSNSPNKALVPGKVVDAAIAAVEAKLAKWTDAVLHTPEIQQIESTWRGLDRLVRTTPFGKSGISIVLMNATKEQLAEDFEEAGDYKHSTMYELIHSMHIDQLGGTPVGVVVTDFEFGPGEADIRLMKEMGKVLAVSHAPLLAAASPEVYGLRSWRDIRTIGERDLEAFHSVHAEKFAAWNSFRKDSPEMRYICLTMPRFLARTPIEQGPQKGMTYRETIGPDGAENVYSSSAFLLAERIHESFARSRWHGVISGVAGGGYVKGLPICQFESAGETRTIAPLELDRLPLAKQKSLTQGGLSVLVWEENTSSAAFFCPRSVFGDLEYADQADTRNSRQLNLLSVLLPASRLSHLFKQWVIANSGRFTDSNQLQQKLQAWSGQFVNAIEESNQEELQKRPFRSIAVRVEDDPTDASMYEIYMEAIPHLPFMDGRLDLCVSARKSGPNRA